jgi:hypothetical protein
LSTHVSSTGPVDSGIVTFSLTDDRRRSARPSRAAR